MSNLSKLIELASDKMEIDEEGRICYESIVEREWRQSGEDFELLMLLLEDHICEEEDTEGTVYEAIDWTGVEDEYIAEKVKNAS